MSKEGQIYAIAFGDMLKVGRAANAVSRMSAHRTEATRHGKKVIGEWISPPHPGWRGNEAKLIEFCASLGGKRNGNSEYFTGLDFEQVRTYAEALVANDPVPKPEPQKETVERFAFGDIHRTRDERWQVMLVGSPNALRLMPDLVLAVPVVRMDDLTSKPHPFLAESIPGVGMALITRPTIIPIGSLIDDEPFARLDPGRHATVARRIRNLIGP